MNLSDSPGLPLEVADTTLSSPTPLKLSYDRPSSPLQNCYLCSPPSEQHSPSLPLRSSSPASSSERSQSPVQSPLSPLTYPNQGNDPSPERSPSYFAFMGSPREASPHSYRPNLSCTLPNLSLGSLSSSPHVGCDSLSTPSPPSPQPPDFPISRSPMPSASSSSPTFESLPPPSLARRAWSPSSPCRSPGTPYRDERFGSSLSPIDLSLSGTSASSRRKRPFYSLSPKVEVDSEGSPSPSLIDSPPSSPFPAPAAEEIPSGDDSHRSHRQRRHHRRHQRLQGVSSEASISPSAPPVPAEVVVDVGEGSGRSEGPLCVVDLTNEEEEEEEDDNDDDDVEIVAADQPVVFLGSEASSRRRKRRRRHDLRPDSRPESANEELIVIGDSTPDPTPIEVSDSPDTTLRTSSSVDDIPNEGTINPSRTNDAPLPPQLFGDLLQRPVIPLERDNASGSGSGVSRMTYLEFCGVHRFTARAQPSDRSRSVMEAPIPPDVLEDIVSLAAERRPRQLSPNRRLSSLSLRTETNVRLRPSTANPNLTFPAAPTQPPPAPPRPPSGDGSGDLSCPICFESFKDLKRESKSVSSTVCGHIFCTHCLEAYFKRAKQCPTCRKRLSKKQYHRLFI